jgi:hypothetical protein
VPAGDARALEEALRALVGDAGARHRMGQAARRRAATFCDVPTELRRLQRALTSSRPSLPMAVEAHAG